MIDKVTRVRDFAGAIYMPSFLMATSRGLLIPVFPLYLLSFDISYGIVGLLLAAESIGTLVSDIPAGKLLRKFSKKTCMLLGIILVTISTGALFWIDQFLLIFALRLISGVGMALWGTSRHAYMAEAVNNNHRGRSIAVLGGLGRAGTFVGPVLGGVLGSEFGLGKTFIICSLFSLIGLIFVFNFVSTPRQLEISSSSPDKSLFDVFSANRRLLMIAGAGQLCAQMVRSARSTIVPLYGGSILGLDVQSIGVLIGFSSAIDVLMSFPAGLIMDRLGRKLAYLPSFILLAFGMLLIPTTTDYWSLQLVVLLMGFGNGLGAGSMMTLGADLAPIHSRGEFLGLWRFIGDGGSACSPLIIGIIAERMGLFGAPVVAAILGLIGVSILGWGVPETLNKSKQTL